MAQVAEHRQRWPSARRGIPTAIGRLEPAENLGFWGNGGFWKEIYDLPHDVSQSDFLHGNYSLLPYFLPIAAHSSVKTISYSLPIVRIQAFQWKVDRSGGGGSISHGRSPLTAAQQEKSARDIPEKLFQIRFSGAGDE